MKGNNIRIHIRIFNTSLILYFLSWYWKTESSSIVFQTTKGLVTPVLWSSVSLQWWAMQEQPCPGLQKSWETRQRYDVGEQLDNKRAGRQGQGLISVSDARAALSWITKELVDKAKVWYLWVMQEQTSPGLQKSWETRPRYHIGEQCKNNALLDYKRAGR